MPIYGFECTACGHRFDRLQKLSDPDPTQCPACEADTLRRQLTAPSFRLAGSGWYETDFKKDGDKKRNLADGGDGAKPESTSDKGSGSSESKPGTQSDSKPAAGSTDSKPAAASATPAASSAPAKDA